MQYGRQEVGRTRSPTCRPRARRRASRASRRRQCDRPRELSKRVSLQTARQPSRSQWLEDGERLAARAATQRAARRWLATTPSLRGCRIACRSTPSVQEAQRPRWNMATRVTHMPVAAAAGWFALVRTGRWRWRWQIRGTSDPRRTCPPRCTRTHQCPRRVALASCAFAPTAVWRAAWREAACIPSRPRSTTTSSTAYRHRTRHLRRATRPLSTRRQRGSRSHRKYGLHQKPLEARVSDSRQTADCAPHQRALQPSHHSPPLSHRHPSLPLCTTRTPLANRHTRAPPCRCRCLCLWRLHPQLPYPPVPVPRQRQHHAPALRVATSQRSRRSSPRNLPNLGRRPARRQAQERHPPLAVRTAGCFSMLLLLLAGLATHLMMMPSMARPSTRARAPHATAALYVPRRTSRDRGVSASALT